MNPNVKAPTVSNVERRQCADELVKLIRKLRWVGLDEEAQRMQARLRYLEPYEVGSVVAECGSTD